MNCSIQSFSIIVYRAVSQWIDVILRFLTLTNFSEGAKQPTQRDSRIQPRAWLLLDVF